MSEELVEIKETKKEGSKKVTWSEAFRSPKLKKDDPLKTETFKGCTTILEGLKHITEKKKDSVLYEFRRCIKEHLEKDVKTGKGLVTYEHGPVKKLTYGEAFQLEQWLAAGLKKFAPELKPKSLFGIYMDSCVEWSLVMYANFMLGLTNVTCYANLGEENFVKIINQGELSILIAHSKAIKFLDSVAAPQCKSLRKVVLVGPPNKNYRVKNLEVVNFYDLVKLGRKNPIKYEDFPLCKKDDLSYIMYTSGTTGDPKGVMMSHANVVSGIAGMVDHVNIVPGDKHISYLPMAHIFELVLQNAVVAAGCSVGFGGPRTLLCKPGGSKKIGDLAAYRPTIFPGVPRVWDTIKKAVLAKVKAAGGIKEKLFDIVYTAKMGNLKKGSNKNHILENLVFKKVRQLVGGKVRVIVSGGAPLSGDTQQFLQSAMGKKCAIVQGYALTETCSATTCQSLEKFAPPGCTGEMLTCAEVRLRDVPEMSYFVKDGKGEVCIGGPMTTLGYYKMKDKTDEVYIMHEGKRWFCTGDIGEITKDHTLKIIDRVKNIAKLSSGEYVAVEVLETLYGNSSFVMPNGIMIVADSLQANVVGLICVDNAHILYWAKENGIASKDIEELIKRKDLKSEMTKEFKNIAQTNKFKKWERLDTFTLLTDQWTPENDMLTSAMKKKRRNLKKKYVDHINKMYGRKGVEKVDKKESVVVIPKGKAKKVKIPGYFAYLSKDY